LKIKTKLTLGVGILFILIIILSVIGTYYINALAKDTKNILVANYNTLDYSRQMLISLEKLPNDSNAVNNFRTNLSKQENNITEIGERETTGQIHQIFEQLLIKSDNDKYIEIRKNIYELMRLNMDAIIRKSNIADKTANNATIWIAFAGTLCFLIAFTLLINFPSNIANPIKILADSIKEIANKNYSQRINFENHDEFGDVATAFNSMAAKLKEYESSNISQLLFEKKRIETLINKMHDPIIGLNEEKKILFANEEALAILALNSEDIIGKSAQDIALTNDLMRSLIKDMIIKQVTTIKPEQLKIFAKNKESYFEKEIINITSIPTGEKESKLIGYVILLKNITPFKELDVLKTNFIGTISHELKTPISSILMSLNLLQDKRVGNANEEQKQLMQNIKEDSERLLKITGELLNITQAETGKIQLNIQPTSPIEIIETAINATKTLAEQNDISIETNCANNISNIIADKEKTIWVLVNLISNAIRYSHQYSKIVITAKEINNNVELSVQDFGKGIDSKYIDKIFDRYFRIPGNDKKGTGLGLSISKEFIEAQNGKINVDSQIGFGSIFSILLEKSIT